jgi:hypothetical protein
MQLKDDAQKSEISEELVTAIIKDQMKSLENEFSSKLSQIEAKLARDFDSRLQK